MKLRIKMPDKIFGKDSRLLVLALPPLGLLLAMVLSFGILIMPRFTQGKESLVEAEEVRNKNKDIKSKTAYLASMDKEEIKRSADKLSQGLLPEKSAYLLVGVVRRIGEKYGYAIDDFSIGTAAVDTEEKEKPVSSKFEKLPVQVSLIGPYQNYIPLLQSLEKSLPVVSIDSLEMETDAAVELAVAKLNLSAYYLPSNTKQDVERLSLSDLTPSQSESELLTRIGEYEVMSVEKRENTGDFVRYERENPFATP